MDQTNKKMKNIFIYEAGNTLGSYKTIVEKLTKRGAKEVESPDKSNVSIVFCPIVSRFETDINAALSSAKEMGCTTVILVAMHHTFDSGCILPNHRQQSDPAVILMVDCLFFEKKGLLSCTCNKNAVKTVRKTIKLKGIYSGVSSFYQTLLSEDNLQVSQLGLSKTKIPVKLGGKLSGRK